MFRVTSRTFASKFGPLNSFAFWADDQLSQNEERVAKFGERFRATEMFSNWGFLKSTGRLRQLSKKLDRVAQPPAQEVTKVTDDSLLLFYSEATARHLPIIRFVDTASPLYVLILGTTWSSAISYGAMMAFYIPFIRGLGHSSVVRMDLIPSMEAIAFQKVGFFGSVRTEMVPIKNLTKIKVEHSRYQYFHNYYSNGGLDRDLLFKDWATGIEYGFEINGTWDEKNLEHPLIHGPHLHK